MREGLGYLLLVVVAVAIAWGAWYGMVKTMPPLKIEITNPEQIFKFQIQLEKETKDVKTEKKAGVDNAL